MVKALLSLIVAADEDTQQHVSFTRYCLFLFSYRRMSLSDEVYLFNSRCMMHMLPSVKVQQGLPHQQVRTSFNMWVH